ASGMPMIVKASAMAVSRWPMASQRPATMNQITLPIAEGAPASARRSSVRPKGHSAKFAIRKEARPKGIVMISRQHTIPAITYPIAIHRPHSSSQMMLSSVRTLSILPGSALSCGAVQHRRRWPSVLRTQAGRHEQARRTFAIKSCWAAGRRYPVLARGFEKSSHLGDLTTKVTGVQCESSDHFVDLSKITDRERLRAEHGRHGGVFKVSTDPSPSRYQ